LLKTVGVAVVSGPAFGSQGEGYVRVTYATSNEDIDEGVKRIKEANLVSL
jgi:aminotransferase